MKCSSRMKLDYRFLTLDALSKTKVKVKVKVYFETSVIKILLFETQRTKKIFLDLFKYEYFSNSDKFVVTFSVLFRLSGHLGTEEKYFRIIK